MKNDKRELCAFCEDCHKKVELIIYNSDTNPVILCCKDCWQFLQQ